MPYPNRMKKNSGGRPKGFNGINGINGINGVKVLKVAAAIFYQNFDEIIKNSYICSLNSF